jgi:hypothetical protein
MVPSDPITSIAESDPSLVKFLKDLQELGLHFVKEFADLSPEQRVAWRDEYERRLKTKKSWDPGDETERRKTAAAFSLNFAQQNPAAPARLVSVVATTLRPPTDLRRFSLALARQMCPSDALVYRYLQEEQAKLTASYAPAYNERERRRWVPGYSAQFIHGELKCFKDSQTVLDAVDRLEGAGLIMTERTGKFIRPDLRTGRKRDIAMWLHVSAPLDRAEETVTVEAADALKYGLSLGMLVSLIRMEPDAQKRYATDLAKRLPLSVDTIRELRKKVPKV